MTFDYFRAIRAAYSVMRLSSFAGALLLSGAVRDLLQIYDLLVLLLRVNGRARIVGGCAGFPGLLRVA